MKEANDTLCLRVALETERSHSLLKVSPKMHDEVKALAAKLNWQPIDVTTKLLEYAMQHVEISKSLDTGCAASDPIAIDGALVDAVADEVMARLNLDSAGG